MNRHSTIRDTRAFTLVEMLCVLVIIGLLAALLLPAVAQGKARAKRVQCASQLRQIGVGFQAFAHDHQSRFPMAVPLAAGGTMELVTNAYRVGGDFYFSFRHFQALAAELSTPRVLACPADTRQPAGRFENLENRHVSYFVAVKAEEGRPGSLLAGDRNLTNDWLGQPSWLRIGPYQHLRWTGEMHQYRGNLLFADGHVEQRASAALVISAEQPVAMIDLFLPTVKPVATGPRPRPSAATPSGGSQAAPAAAATKQPQPPAAPEKPRVDSHVGTTPGATLPMPGPAAPAVEPARPAPVTNPAAPPPQAPPPRSSTADEPWYFTPWASLAAQAQAWAHRLGWLLYLVLLALILATLAVRRHFLRKRRPETDNL